MSLAVPLEFPTRRLRSESVLTVSFRYGHLQYMVKNKGPIENLGFDRASDEYKRLVEAVSAGAILFVGAGSSCRIGYPSWSSLLDTMHDIVLREIPKSIEAIRYLRNPEVSGLLRASEYRRTLGDARYFEVLRDTFGLRSPQHDTFHEALISPPYKHVLTTNYDGILESAHERVHAVRAQFFDLDEWELLSEFRQVRVSSLAQRRYIHVHGSIRRSDGIVLCNEDYNSRYIQETRSREFLRQLLTAERIVFVCFSLQDEDIRYILREVAGNLEYAQPRHFIVLPDPANAEKSMGTQLNLRSQYGIEVVWFDNSAGDFISLEQLIRCLNDDVHSAIKSNPHRQVVTMGDVQSAVEKVARECVDWPTHLEDKLLDQLQLHSNFNTAGDNRNSTTDIDSEINRVFDFVKDGLPDRAIDGYESLRVKYESELTSKQRYRLAANIGNALYSKHAFGDAADAYLNAVGFWNESPQSKCLEVLAYILQGDDSRALTLCKILCDEEPKFPQAWSLWIQSQPETRSFESIENDISTELRNNAEVAMALSCRARQEKITEACECHARTSVKEEPDWAFALATLGTAILSSELEKRHETVDSVQEQASITRLREAEELISEAIDKTPPTDPARELAALHYNRARARQLIGDYVLAEQDLAEAFRRDPSNPTITLAYATRIESSAVISGVLQAIKAISLDAPEYYELQFARLWLLAKREASGDLQVAIHDIRQLIEQIHNVNPQWLQADIVRLGLNVLVKLNRGTEGRELISSLPVGLMDASTLERLHTQAELMAGNDEAAKEHLAEAIRTLDENASWFDRRDAAILAEECDLHAQAYQLWKSIRVSRHITSDIYRYFRCAYLAGEWKTVLEMTSLLRAKRQLTHEYILAEAEILHRCREPERAMRTLTEWLTENPDDKEVRLQLSLLALSEEMLESACFDEHKLPSIMDFATSEGGIQLAYLLRRGPAPIRGVEVAYELFRRFPNDAVAQHTLVCSIFDFTAPPIELDHPTEVGANSSVQIRRHVRGESSRWYYIECDSDPNPSINEIGKDHQLAMAAWGKCVGERFKFQGHEYEIVAIENKILRRKNEIMEEFEERFPDRTVLRRFNVPTELPPDSSVKKALGEVYSELHSHEKRGKQIQQMYEGDEIPLAGYAKLKGRSVFDTARHLALSTSCSVRAARGNPREWFAACGKIQTAKELVLDATALVSLHAIDFVELLLGLGAKLTVPRTVVDEVREASLTAANTHGPRRRIGVFQGRLFLHESSSEELAAEVASLERVLAFVQEHCEVVGGEATLELPTDLRLQLESLLGASSTDALALAKSRRAILWTDDGGLRTIAGSTDFGVAGVWTQALLGGMWNIGTIQEKNYTDLVGKLLVHRYEFPALNARDVVWLFRNSNWRLRSPLASATVRFLSTTLGMNPENRLITANVFRLIWQNCERRCLARNLIVAVLERVGWHNADSLVSAVMEQFHDKSLRPLRRLLRSWRGRDGEFKPGRGSRRTVTRWIAKERYDGSYQ